jgi:hypothetical protein
MTAHTSSIASGLLIDEFPYIWIGTGPRPLLIIPGAEANNADPGWLAQQAMRAAFRRFARDHSVYIVHRRRGLPAPYSTAQMAADYARVLRAIAPSGEAAHVSRGLSCTEERAAAIGQRQSSAAVGREGDVAMQHRIAPATIGRSITFTPSLPLSNDTQRRTMCYIACERSSRVWSVTRHGRAQFSQPNSYQPPPRHTARRRRPHVLLFCVFCL